MQNLRATFSNCIMLITCFLIITGCTDSSYRERLVRESQCIPIPFQATQSLDPLEESYKQVDVDKPIQEIADYYFEILAPVDVKDLDSFVYGAWRIQDLAEPASGVLFDCYNSIDRLTKETGCIYLHIKDEEVTTIEYMWNLGELAPGCSSSMEQ